MAARLPHGSDLLHREWKINEGMDSISSPVFQVQTDGSGGDDAPRSFRRVLRAIAVASLDICRDRNRYGTSDACHHPQHLFAADPLPVRMAQPKRDPRAGGSNGFGAGVFENTRAGYVPAVREH